MSGKPFYLAYACRYLLDDGKIVRADLCARKLFCTQRHKGSPLSCVFAFPFLGSLQWRQGVIEKSYQARSRSIFPFTHFFEGIPTVVVYGDRTASGPGGECFYQAINGPKDKLVVQGADHFDLYWKPEYVEPAVAKVSAYLKAQM